MCSALLVLNVFAEKTYESENGNVIENTSISVSESTLESTIDSLEFKSTQLNKADSKFQSNSSNYQNNRNNRSSEKQDLQKNDINNLEMDMPLSTMDAKPLLNLSMQNEETYEYDAYLERIRLKNKKRLDKVKIISLYSAAIILNGIGDGMNNTHRKTMGHIFNAASIGVLLSTPFIIDYDCKKWYWYLLTYTSLRVTLFDASYNVTTNQPIDFIGSTAITDKLYTKAAELYGASKAMGLVVGLTIPFRIL